MKALESAFRNSSERNFLGFSEGPNGIHLLLPQQNFTMVPYPGFLLPCFILPAL